MNDVWLKIAQFLGTLNGENVKRESYVRTPEYEAALEAWKETEQEKELWPDFEYDYPEESGWRKACVICLSLFIALGRAVLWPGIPLIISGGILLVRLAERFPEFFGNMMKMDSDEPENSDAD